jgi:S-ribosylhomocysteine lyase LuxS involved in autoinducer biosynthesis
LGEWLEIKNGVTGLYPFMSMATESNDYNLEEVYEFAMMNLNSILQRELPASNTKQCGNFAIVKMIVSSLKRMVNL